MEEEVKLDPEEAELVKGIIFEAFEEMENQSQLIASQGDMLMIAYVGSGTGRGLENYAALGSSGAALANALDALAQDLGVTVMEGHTMDGEASAAMNRAGGADFGVAHYDSAIARAV